MLTPPPDTAPLDPQPISTGSLRLDLALRTGGILPGEVVEISGPPDSGKTTLCLHLAASANRLGGVCVWLDADHLLDPAWALRLGVDPQQTLVAHPRDPACAADMLTSLAASRSVSLIIIDSLSGLLDPDDPGADQHLSLALRRLSPGLQRRQLSLALTRRAPAGGPAYHQLSTHLSRLATRLYTGVRIRLEAPALIRSGAHIIGQRVIARVQRLALAGRPAILHRPDIPIRRKIPPCYGAVELDIMYNQCIIRIGEIFDLGLQLGLIHHREGAFIVEDRDLGPDRAAAITALERLGLAAHLEQIIRQKLLRNERLYR